MLKKFLTAAAAALAALLAFTGCSGNGSAEEYGEFGDYYPELGYEVKNGDGVVTERFYFLCTDPELKDAVGKKDVYFDPDTGEITRYNVTIGVDKVEEVVSYSKGENSSYYTEMFFNDDQVMSSGTWNNEYLGEDGVRIAVKGEQTYHPGGSTVKTFREEEYHDGKLYSTTTREYAEDGTLVSENIE